MPFIPRLIAAVAILAAATPVLADEDDHDFDPGPPLIGTPVTPLLPALGTFARATATRANFTGCAAYGLGDISVIDVGPNGFADTVRCNDSVYDSFRSEDTTTTPGQRVDASTSRSSAEARASLLGPGNVVTLAAGSRSANTRDAVFDVDRTVDVNGNQDGWSPGNVGFSGPPARVIGEQDSAGSSSLARLADTVVADGSGRLRIEFSVDGLFERGSAFRDIIDTGGRVSFAAVLLDPLGLEEIDLGGDFGTVRQWRDGAIASAGFALGRDARDSVQRVSQFPDGELLLGSADLRGFARRTSEIPSADLPTSPTEILRQLSLELDLEDGKTYWLIAGLFTSASGWNPFDSQPGDGTGGGGGIICDFPCPGDGGTVVDFTNTARLSAVTLGEGLRGLTSASGVDYQLAVNPVPLPAGAWLLGTGVAVLGGRWWRARGRRAA
jgi:hypothetical protein